MGLISQIIVVTLAFGVGLLQGQGDTDFRLPTALVPNHYDIRIIPILDEGIAGFPRWSAPGSVRINVTCVEPTNEVILHSAGIAILPEDVEIRQDDQVVPIGTPEFIPELDFYRIPVPGGLDEDNEYVIEIKKYVAEVRDTSQATLKVGLYRAAYTDSNGAQKWLALTQLDTIGFRRFTPGLDEPQLKATFTLHVGRSTGYNSASNAAIDGDAGQDDDTGTLPPNWVWDHFQETVPMAPYLLALVVSDFTRRAAPAALYPPKPVGIIAPSHLANIEDSAQFAAETSAKILGAYDNFFGPELLYSMHKMDSVAVPRDYFTFGAMENWGLVTYRDNLILYYPTLSLEAERFRIASIVSHELSHQWFGNWVTAKWWSNIWLNEGFATYMALKGVDLVETVYEAERQVISNYFQVAYTMDAGPGSHPMLSPYVSKQEVEAASFFDDINYEKGASILRMMEAFVGKDNLYEAFRSYLLELKYDSVEQDDLFGHVQQVATGLPAGKTVKSIMDTWTTQKGYPVVRVKREGENAIFLSQENYASSDKTFWDIPVAIAFASDVSAFNDVKPKLWIHAAVGYSSYSEVAMNTSSWVVVNPEAYGYYRVLYDQDLAAAIQRQLEANSSVIPGITQGQILNDYFQFAADGHVTYEEAFNFTKHLSNVGDHAVWTPFLDALAPLWPYFGGSTTEVLEPFQNYFLPKFEGALNSTSWEQGSGEHGVKVILRANLLEWACRLGHARCNEIANEFFATWISGAGAANPIPVDLRQALYCAAVAQGDRFIFDFLYHKYAAAILQLEISAESTRILQSLACSPNSDDLLRLLTNAVDSNEGILKAHVRLIFERVGINPAGRSVLYQFLRANRALLESYMGTKDFTIRVISSIATYQNSEGETKRIFDLIDTLGQDDGLTVPQRVTMLDAVSRIQHNKAWVDRHAKPIAQWFLAQGPQTTAGSAKYVPSLVGVVVLIWAAMKM